MRFGTLFGSLGGSGGDKPRPYDAPGPVGATLVVALLRFGTFFGLTGARSTPLPLGFSFLGERPRTLKLVFAVVETIHGAELTLAHPAQRLLGA